jgi:molybdenum cofactor biosynthesis enzyme MoaA
MPQGPTKRTADTGPAKTHKKAEIRQRAKRVWKKHKDAVRAAIAKKVEAVVMDRALKDPLHGGLRFIKPTEEKAKAASIPTKSLIKDPTQKIN